MFTVLYYRKEANVFDVREFRDLNEFNDWLDAERKLNEIIDIIRITEDKGSE